MMEQKIDKGIIFDIQYGAMYDGPGLRTVIFFKGCPLRCRWCQNPESQEMAPQLSFLAERCISCGTCVEVCPSENLKMDQGFPLRVREGCRLCGRCARNCLSNAMELIGYEISAADILHKVLRDRLFYEKSGGGATISGGEPTMQYRFLIKTLAMLREYNISTALETCGYFESLLIDELIGVTDLFLFDIKHANGISHKKNTGKDIRLIKKNFREILAKAGEQRVIPRIPLIPGFNTDKESVAALAKYLNECGYKGEIHLMPYNPLAKTKYRKINRHNEYQSKSAQTPEELRTITGAFKKSCRGEVVLIN